MVPFVDPEFRGLIPPLRSDELDGLEASLREEGCRDPLVVWTEEGILLDGHNRLSICERLGIPFETTSISLPDREAARDWIEANALHRRNLTPDQIRMLRGRRYNRAKRQGERTDLTSGQSDQKSEGSEGTTAEKLAAEHGVSEKTIRRDGKAVAAIEADEDLKREVVEGKVTLHEAARRSSLHKKVSRLPEDERERAGAFLREIVDDGNPTKVALDVADNLLDMPQEDRSRIYVLNESADPRERELARTEAARLPPMPHPAILPIRTAITELSKARKHVNGSESAQLEAHRKGLQDLVQTLRSA